MTALEKGGHWADQSGTARPNPNRIFEALHSDIGIRWWSGDGGLNKCSDLDRSGIVHALNPAVRFNQVIIVCSFRCGTS